MTTRTLLLTAAVCIAGLSAQAQGTTGYGSSAFGGMTPQPTGGVTAGAPTGLEQGFADFANGVNAAPQQATSNVGTAVDSLGRAIVRPFENVGQTISDIAHGPENRGATTPGQPLRNLVEGTGRELQNTGEAFRDSFGRTGENIRNALGVSSQETSPQNDPLRQPAPGWNGQTTAISNPGSWGTTADPLASPPPSMQQAGITAGDANAARSVLVNPNTQPTDTRPTWSNAAPPNAAPTNATTAANNNQFAPPPLQNPPQQQQQQPTGNSQYFDRLVDRGPALGNPASGNLATGAIDNWGNPAAGRSLSPIPGAETPWGVSQPVMTTADTWSDPLRTTFPTQPLGTSGPAMPRLEIPSSTTTPTMMVSDRGNLGSGTNADAMNLLAPQNGNRTPTENTNPQTVNSGFLSDGNLGWTAVWFVLFAGTLTANLYQWFSILDLRNKYRGALRRSSPSLAR